MTANLHIVQSHQEKIRLVSERLALLVLGHHEPHRLGRA